MNEDIANVVPIGAIEFRDDGKYEVVCPKGHKSITLLQEQKFEILFDIGAYAIVDGYYREAVSSFTSSLERFYEFFIWSLLFGKGLTDDLINSAWKQVSNQSERQLGAFIFLYTSEFGRLPTLLSNSNIQFRNDVVHKGKIPSRSEAVAYGQAVLNVVRPILAETKDKLPEAVTQAVFHHLKRARGKTEDHMAVATAGIATILSLTRTADGYGERTLEDAIAGLRRW